VEEGLLTSLPGGGDTVLRRCSRRFSRSRDVSGIVLLELGFAAGLRRSLAGLKLLDLV